MHSSVIYDSLPYTSENPSLGNVDVNELETCHSLTNIVFVMQAFALLPKSQISMRHQ